MPSGASSPRVQTAAIVVDIGAATGGDAISIVDARKNWAINQWTGYLVQIFKLGGSEYYCRILSNTANQLNFAALPAGIVVSPGDLYTIQSAFDPAGAKLIRWGRDVDPTWVHAAEVIAPLIGAVLVTQAVTAGMVGYIYGFFIACTEANSFLVNWTSATVAYSKRMVFGAAGSMEAIDNIAFNEGLPADAGSNITITNVVAGAGATVYQAGLLYAEI